LLLILWNPSRPKVSETISRNSVLAVFDTSESMSVVEDGSMTRLDKALSIFEEKLHPLDPDGPDYKIFGFDRQTYHSGSSDFLRRWGSQTNMHSILAVLSKYDIAEEANYARNAQQPDAQARSDFGNGEAVKNSRVTGAIIFTDGEADDKNIPAYLPPGKKDFQIVLVGVGSRNRQTDVAVKSVIAPSRMAIDTACDVRVAVAGRNLPNEPVTIELLKNDSVIDSKELAPEAFAQGRRTGHYSYSPTEDVTVEFAVGGDRLGSFSLSARVKPLDREVNLANNARSTMVEVVEETGLKVLLYSQEANFNIGKIRQVLATDAKIELDLGLDVIKRPALSQSSSRTCGYVKLPDDRHGFYKYDTIILGPCDLDGLTNAQIDGLYSFVVDRGGGLILLPGKVDSGPAAWTNSKARALVPVIFDYDEPTIWPSSPGKIELTLEGADSKLINSAALTDYDEPASPYYRIIDTKPAATTLARVKDMPLISIHRVGRGRVCLLNASKLFLWYREDLQGGLLCKLVAGLTSHLGRITAREATVELFAERAAEQANKVKFEAYVCDKSFVHVAGANVLLTVRGQVVSMDDIGGGYYVAEVGDIADQAIVAMAQAETNGVFLGEKTIAVNLPPTKTEMTNVELDAKFLRALAEKLNGKYFHSDDMGQNVAELFEAEARVGSSRRMASVWPNWPLLMVLCVLLGANWFLRRRLGLV
jgi:hypothetical protein